MENKKLQFETEAIHAGYQSVEHLDSLVPPLYQTSTFTFDSAEQGERRFAGQEEGFVYSRLGNPTVKILEDRMARLEQGEAGLAFSSGMAAVSAVLAALTKSGDQILCSQGVYGCTFGLLQMMNEKYNIDHDFSAMTSRGILESDIKSNTTCMYIETPINPTMKLVDLELVASVAKQRGIHSATKYICGHGDVIAGVVIGKREFIQKVSKTTQKIWEESSLLSMLGYY